MAAIAYTPGHDTFAVHVGPRGQVVEHARKNPLRSHVRFDRRLTGAWHVYRDYADAAAEHRVPPLNFVLLTRIGSIDHEYKRRRPHILWQPNVSDNLFVLERDVYDFDRWVEESPVIAKCS